MSKHFRDYYWDHGTPKGVQALSTLEVKEGKSYKIPADPYFKHLSVESYEKESFSKLIYDSQYLNFKHLTPEHQHAWEREFLEKGTACLIRDQNDRVILKEYYTFKEDLCQQCTIFSANDFLIATQIVYYELFGSSFNGVIFFDANDHPVMLKEYEIDEENNFTQLIKTIWDFSPHAKIKIPATTY